MNYSQQVQYHSIAGKVAVITGGASGIGEELVRAFVSQGAKVAFLDFDKLAGEALAHELDCLFLFCDVTDLTLLKACFTTIEKQLGSVDILINNAGSDDHHKLEDLTEEYFENRININLRHQLFAIQAVLPGMERKGSGSIINMGSINWMRGRPGESATPCQKPLSMVLPVPWRRSWAQEAFGLTAWYQAQSVPPNRMRCGRNSTLPRCTSLSNCKHSNSVSMAHIVLAWPSS